MGARWLTDEQYEAHQRKFGKVSLAVPVAKAVLVPVKRATRSELDAELQRQIEASQLPQPRYDVAYLVGSRCRADVLFDAGRLVVEVQGGCHVIRAKAHADIRKAAESLLQGWRLLPVDKDSIYDGSALKWIMQLLKGA